MLRKLFSTMLMLAALALSLTHAVSDASARAGTADQFVAAEQAAPVAAADQAIVKQNSAIALYAKRESQTIKSANGFARPPLVATRGVSLPPARAVTIKPEVARARHTPLRLMMNSYRGLPDPTLNC